MGARNAFLLFPFRWCRFLSGRQSFEALHQSSQVQQPHSRPTVGCRALHGFITSNAGRAHLRSAYPSHHLWKLTARSWSTSWRAGVTIGDDVQASIEFLVQFQLLWFCGGPLRGKERHSRGCGSGSFLRLNPALRWPSMMCSRPAVAVGLSVGALARKSGEGESWVNCKSCLRAPERASGRPSQTS